MSEMVYDVIIIGLGAMGSAAAYQLSKRGATVLGLDQFSPPHNLGSSHGETRITRQAVGEGVAYIPLVQRSNELWRELEAETGEPLLKLTGGYIIGPNDGNGNFHGLPNFVSGTATIAQKFNIDHKICSAAQVRQHLPMINMRDQEQAYYEPRGGILLPDRIIEAQLRLARQNGAHLRLNEPVLDLTSKPAGVMVTTPQRSYTAAKVIISAGSWVAKFLPETQRRYIGVYRQVFYWFEVDDESLFHERQFPWLMWLGSQADDIFGLFPMVGGGISGIKVLTEQFHRTTTPASLDRTVQPDEIQNMRDRFLKSRVQGIGPRCIKTTVCMYTVTPDQGFIIDRHPDSERVIIASPCSGHGFKHSAAVGEILAQLALDESVTTDISSFSLSRF